MTTVEVLSSNTKVYRKRVKPQLAATAGVEARTLMNVTGLDQFLDKETDLAVHGPGNTALEFALGDGIPRWQKRYQRDVMKWSAGSPKFRNIGRLLLDAQYKKRSRGYPLSFVGVHVNDVLTEFRPHFDGIEGCVTSLALSEGIFRLHGDDHSVIREVELKPGDEIAFRNPAPRCERDIHSFAATEAERVSLVSKFRTRQADASLDPTQDYAGYYAELFTPR